MPVVLGKLTCVSLLTGDAAPGWCLLTASRFQSVLCVARLQNYWILDEVVSEIRDARARGRLEALPFEVKSRRPTEAALAFGAWRWQPSL